MGVLGYFKITDYQGQEHEYYRFGDAHPSDYSGIFANFPQGDRDFCLETYVRRLRLEKSNRDYIVDVSYKMDLRSRTIEVSSKCFEDIDFKGTFEEAIRHFADEEYSEKDALAYFPEESDLRRILYPGFLDGSLVIAKAVSAAIPWLKYDYFSSKELYIGDNISFYLYEDFIDYSYYISNNSIKAAEDAYANARRVGLLIYFDNDINNQKVSVFYMITVTHDGYILPLTQIFIPYGEGIPDKIKQEELDMLVMMLKSNDPKDFRGMNFLLGIHPKSELEEIRNKIKE